MLCDGSFVDEMLRILLKEGCQFPFECCLTFVLSTATVLALFLRRASISHELKLVSDKLVSDVADETSMEFSSGGVCSRRRQTKDILDFELEGYHFKQLASVRNSPTSTM